MKAALFKERNDLCPTAAVREGSMNENDILDGGSLRLSICGAVKGSGGCDACCENTFGEFHFLSFIDLDSRMRRSKSRQSQENRALRLGHLPPTIVVVSCRVGPDGTSLQSCRMNATRAAFSSCESFASRIRLKNSTVSSSVSSRPSWKYGGDSLIPRSGNVLIGPCAVATRPLMVCVL